MVSFVPVEVCLLVAVPRPLAAVTAMLRHSCVLVCTVNLHVLEVRCVSVKTTCKNQVVTAFGLMFRMFPLHDYILNDYFENNPCFTVRSPIHVAFILSQAVSGKSNLRKQLVSQSQYHALNSSLF